MELPLPAILAGGEHDAVLVRLQHDVRQHPLALVHVVVGQGAARQGHGRVGAVVQLDPVAGIAVGVRQHGLVPGHDLGDVHAVSVVGRVQVHRAAGRHLLEGDDGILPVLAPLVDIGGPHCGHAQRLHQPLTLCKHQQLAVRGQLEPAEHLAALQALRRVVAVDDQAAAPRQGHVAEDEGLPQIQRVGQLPAPQGYRRVGEVHQLQPVVVAALDAVAHGGVRGHHPTDDHGACRLMGGGQKGIARPGQHCDQRRQSEPAQLVRRAHRLSPAPPQPGGTLVCSRML